MKNLNIPNKNKSPWKGIRRATPEEVDFFYNQMISVQQVDMADLVRHSAENYEKPDDGLFSDPYLPIVVKDFSKVGNQTVLLLEPGIHEVPASIFEVPRVFVGLPGACITTGELRDSCPKPILRFVDVEQEEILNMDTGNSSDIGKVDVGYCYFANLVIDAEEPTILQSYFSDNETLTNYLFDCEIKEFIEVFDAINGMVWMRRDWAIQAYGEGYINTPDLGMRVIDSVGEAGFKLIDKTVDNIGRPFLQVAKGIDKLMGW
ncbi:MAG: hypothetical protein HQL69_15515 [Magnetococcales bacterium]|nr:hypothetical protein [Magnetococcales bacterium]